MYQDVKVAVISQDTLFSKALCTLFTLECVPCVALQLEEGLTYATHQSTGCVVLHAEADEIPRSHIAQWLELGMGVVLLSETLSAREVRESLELEPTAVLKAPVNSRRLLDVVYSVLLRTGSEAGLAKGPAKLG